MSDRDGDEDIYVMDTDSGFLQQLTDDPGIDRSPAWSPDGTQIAFVSNRDGDSIDIYVMDADGGNVQQLIGPSVMDGPNDPAWSPDGTRIAFTARGPSLDRLIYVMDADGGNVQQLTAPGDDGPQLAWHPTWSPDGTRIAFVFVISPVALITSAGNIYVMNADGGNLQQLTNTPEGKEKWMVADPAYTAGGG